MTEAAPAAEAAAEEPAAEAATEEPAAEVATEEPAAEVAAEEPAPEADRGRRVAEGEFGADSAAPLENGEAPAGFDIKGNKTSKKFHAPSSPWYDRTNAEVWFRTAEAAEAAGFVNAEAKAEEKAEDKADKTDKADKADA